MKATGSTQLVQRPMLLRKLSTCISEAFESQEDTKPVKIGIGDSVQLIHKINVASAECNKELDVNQLKQRYSAEIRQLFLPFGLIAPGPLSHRDTEFLATQTFLKTRRDPQFITFYELAIHERATPDCEEWKCFVNHMIKNRVFIVEDWTKNNVGNIERIYYDFGLKESSESKELYRGESDASYRAGKATLSVVLWKGSKIVLSEVYKDVQCSSIVVAEAYATLALLFNSVEQNIMNLLIWTDNEAVRDAVNGVLTIRSGSADRDLLMLLRFMRKKFMKLVCMWKPREVMFLSDDLSKNTALQYADEAVSKWSYELSGKALFKITQAPEANKIINNFVCREYRKNLERAFFMTVSDSHKIEALIKIKEAFSWTKFFIAFHRFEERSSEFQKQICDMFKNDSLTHLKSNA